jgi:DNA polymerase eta
LVHVATYAPNETQAQYHANPSIATHKTALDVYHSAGKHIFQIFKQHCPLVQKLGSDEAFLDITAEVNTHLSDTFIPAHPVLLNDKGSPVTRMDDFVLDWTTLNHVVPSAEEKERRDSLVEGSTPGGAVEDPSYCDPTTWFDIQLLVASQMAAKIRKHIFDELHYTCSAGKNWELTDIHGRYSHF